MQVQPNINSSECYNLFSIAVKFLSLFSISLILDDEVADLKDKIYLSFLICHIRYVPICLIKILTHVDDPFVWLSIHIICELYVHHI